MRRFQYSLGAVFIAVAITAVALRILMSVPIGTIIGVCGIEAVFAMTYVLLRQAQDRDNRNSNANQVDSPGNTPYVGL